MDFLLKNVDFITKYREGKGAAPHVLRAGIFILVVHTNTNNDGFCTRNDGFYTRNDGF